MGAAERRQKDSAMASRMKQEGVERRTGRCPICYSLIALDKLEGHIALRCQGTAQRR